MQSRNTTPKKDKVEPLKLVALHRNLYQYMIVITENSESGNPVGTTEYAFYHSTRDIKWYRSNFSSIPNSHAEYFFNIEDCISYLSALDSKAASFFIDQFF